MIFLKLGNQSLNFRFDAFRGIFDSLFSRQQSIQNKTNKSDFRISSFSGFSSVLFFVLTLDFVFQKFPSSPFSGILTASFASQEVER